MQSSARVALGFPNISSTKISQRQKEKCVRYMGINETSGMATIFICLNNSRHLQGKEQMVIWLTHLGFNPLRTGSKAGRSCRAAGHKSMAEEPWLWPGGQCRG